jgi:aryl-alcohol dehydrogenase-like predicted oxidoreductase
MQQVRFGSTGMKVSRLCLGCMTYGTPSWREWVLDEKTSMPFFRQAWEAGINFWDTADMYSLGVSEEITGRAMREFAPRRDAVVLATKVYNPMGPGANQRGLSRKHIMESVDQSLKRLGTDYIDLYQIHRFDSETPIEETIEALNDAVRAGKVLYLGASSGFAWQFVKMRERQRAAGAATFASMQNVYNLVYREEEREMMGYCAAEGLAVIPWSPIARGFLAGNRLSAEGTTTRARTDTVTTDYLKLGSRQDHAIADRVAKLAVKLGVRPAQLALAWVLSKPFVTSPIIGASKPHHIAEAVAALDIRLDARTIAALEEPYRPKAPVAFR